MRPSKWVMIVMSAICLFVGCSTAPERRLVLRLVPQESVKDMRECSAEIWLENPNPKKVRVGDLRKCDLLWGDYVQTFVFRDDVPVSNPEPLGITWPFSVQHILMFPARVGSSEPAELDGCSRQKIGEIKVPVAQDGHYRIWCLLFVPTAEAELGWAFGGNPGFQIRSNEISPKSTVK